MNKFESFPGLDVLFELCVGGEGGGLLFYGGKTN